MTVLAELSYETAVRALDLQERALGEMRQRTGTLLAASSLTASFLGAQTIQRTSSLGVLGGLALIALAASIGLAVYVLLPKQGFTFSHNAVVAYKNLYDQDDEEVRRRLIYWLGELWDHNEQKLEHLNRYYFGAAVMLVLQLVFWTWSLASNIS
jgi:uncharacterized protein HemX